MYNKFMLENILTNFEQVNKSIDTLHLKVVISLIINLIIVIALFKAADALDRHLKNKFKHTDSQSPLLQFLPFLNKIIKGLVLFFIVASFLQSNGYSITSLIAGFGITGLAVGFAAQQTIADFFGTLTIIADKMYKPGDYIRIGEIEGTVEKINLFSSKIRTLDDFLVSIPNNNISSANIINISNADKRRINEVFGVTYDTSDEKLQQAINIIKEVCDNDKDITNETVVFVETLDSSSINIRLLAYVKTSSYNSLVLKRSEIILEIVKRFRAESIDFAFPSQSIYIEKK